MEEIVEGLKLSMGMIGGIIGALIAGIVLWKFVPVDRPTPPPPTKDNP